MRSDPPPPNVVIEPEVTLPQVTLPEVTLLDVIPEELARRARMLPLHVSGGVLHVVHPPGAKDAVMLEDLRMHAGAFDAVTQVHPDAISHLLVAYARRTIATVAHDAVPAAPDAVRLLDALLELAIGSGASDLHLLPTADGLRVRQRIDGDLHPVVDVPVVSAPSLVARAKVRSSLDVAERRLPQDGRFRHVIPDGSVDVRVATMPTRFGERVTLRLLPDGPSGVVLEDLGLPAAALTALTQAVDTSVGLVVVCGPTGSGKTTTLHALLTRLARGPRNIVTLEDPIERIVAGTSQTQIDATHGLGFADGLRHLLRHDPDVMLIGEIRDEETARLAVEAAHTGHLVLTSLHAVDAPGALTRLSELGVPAAMLADTVRVVVAQRLLARPCADCEGDHDDGPCTACMGAGTRGRSAIAEVLELDARLRALLRDGRGPAVHHDALSDAVAPRLRDVALERADAGLARHHDAIRTTAPTTPPTSPLPSSSARSPAAVGTLGI